MAAESRNEAEHDPVESLIDDVIHDILSSASQQPKPTTRRPMVALIESALSSTSRTVSRTSALERLLMTQFIASALADALAPALAEILAPEIMKAVEQYPTGKSGSAEPVSAGSTSEKARKA